MNFSFLRTMAALAPAALGVAGSLALPCVAQATTAVMIESGNQRLREDLQWLIDRQVINFSASTWPISLAALDRALLGRRQTDLSEADMSALRSLQAELEEIRKPLSYGADLMGNSAPFAPMDFESQARGRGQASAYVEGSRGSLAGKLQINGVSQPLSDRQTKGNMEGSYLAAEIGHQIVYAGQLARWWGPGQDGSLIWSNAGTAIPGVGVQRGRHTRFQTPWLSWLGPWSYDVFLGQIQHNQVVPGTRVFNMRLSARPLKGLEIGASRFIQWGGNGNGWRSLADAFVGRANDPSLPANNEVAGFDVRYTFNLGGNPATVYGQVMGEDEAGLLPAKHLVQVGAQYKHEWKTKRVQWYAEATDTMTSRYFGSNTKGANIAYNHSHYRDGLYSDALPIAYFAGGDAKVYSAGVMVAPQDDPRGVRYSAKLMQMDVNPSNQPINQAFPAADRRQVAVVSANWMRKLATFSVSLVGQRSRVNGNDVGLMVSLKFPLG